MLDNQSPIAFFDSGVGGLPYLEASRQIMPGEHFVYLADRAGFPYGTKSRQEVIDRVTAALNLLVRRVHPKVIVVACNTATELAINEIRTKYHDLPVIGTVPAVKPAAMLSRSKRIGIVATPAAAGAGYLSDLAKKWAGDCHVVKIGDGSLVDFIEKKFIGSTHEERIEAVAPSVQNLLNEQVDVIVLGCTHFIHVTREFSELAGPGVAILDSRNGVSARLESMTSACRNTSKPSIPDEMYLTGKGEFGSVYGAFAERFGLKQAGVLD